MKKHFGLMFGAVAIGLVSAPLFAQATAVQAQRVKASTPVVTTAIAPPAVATTITSPAVATTITSPAVAPTITSPAVATTITSPAVAPTIASPTVATTIATPVVAPTIASPFARTIAPAAVATTAPQHAPPPAPQAAPAAAVPPGVQTPPAPPEPPQAQPAQKPPKAPTTPAPAARPATPEPPQTPELAIAPGRERIDPDPVNIRFDVTISYQSGTAAPIKRTAVLTVANNTGDFFTRGSLRSGNNVPVPTTTLTTKSEDGKETPVAKPLTSYSYRSVGLNVDIQRAAIVPGNRVRATLSVEFSGVDEKSAGSVSAPSFPTFSQGIGLYLENGKPVLVAQSSDVVDNVERKQSVEVKATILR